MHTIELLFSVERLNKITYLHKHELHCCTTVHTIIGKQRTVPHSGNIGTMFLDGIILYTLRRRKRRYKLRPEWDGILKNKEDFKNIFSVLEAKEYI